MRHLIQIIFIIKVIRFFLTEVIKMQFEQS